MVLFFTFDIVANGGKGSACADDALHFLQYALVQVVVYADETHSKEQKVVLARILHKVRAQ